MPFLALKTRNLESGKIEIFSKGLVYGFGPKLAIFPSFYFRKYRPRKCVLQYSRTKERFSWPFFYLFIPIEARKMSWEVLEATKTTSSKSLNIDIFPKGLVHGFGPKFAIFQSFYFRQYRPEKCVSRHSKTTKCLFWL